MSLDPGKRRVRKDGAKRCHKYAVFRVSFVAIPLNLWVGKSRERWFCCFNHFLIWMIFCEAAKFNDRDELTNEVTDRRTARNQIQLKLSLANNRDENSHTRSIGVSCVYCVPIASMFVWWCLLQSTNIWSLNQIKPARTTHGVAQVVKVYLNVHAQRAQREAVYCPLPTSIVHIQTLVTPQRLSRCTIFKQFNQ